jgi:hypothetical protein
VGTRRITILAAAAVMASSPRVGGGTSGAPGCEAVPSSVQAWRRRRGASAGHVGDHTGAVETTSTLASVGGLLVRGIRPCALFKTLGELFVAIAKFCECLSTASPGRATTPGRRVHPSARAVADDVLTTQIQDAFDSNRKVYGTPRIHPELSDADVHVGRKRIARLMRVAGIVGCHRRKRSFSITKQNPKADAAPDLVDRQFTATAPNQLWVAEVTYVPTVQGWLYLACVTDVFSRMILGWSMASHRKTDLVVDAVAMAVHRRAATCLG